MTIYLFTSNKFGILGSTLALLSNESNENNKQSSWRDVLPTDHPADPWSFSCHEFNVVSKSVDLDHTKSSMKESVWSLNAPYFYPSEFLFVTIWNFCLCVFHVVVH